ncbi:MAG TPA: 16S rRNA (cytidine(1402)-2'-O)-methyltransferase [Clostridiales bacterium]|nr:MAG: 16S rRNA (cytidine(1402)-2'-O)-methyltransferase [Clostridiales bacterium GWD2_32_59]HAN10124.1 16S rRNA (cytidine(1402)-2'-O)-methyltransferase [Clostridiales bacterium]
MSKLYIVATPIGNLGDVSKRTLDVLNECDLILAEDTRHTIKLLNYFNIKKKMESYHKFNEKWKAEQIVELIKTEDLVVCLVSDAGTPCISDPGYEIVAFAHSNQIEVIGIPGPSAVIDALSISGFEIDKFAFYGFLDRDNKLKEKITEISNSNVKISVIYESPRRVVKLVEKLAESFPNSAICICSDLTKLHERVIRGDIKEVLQKIKNDENIEKGEYVVILQNQEVKDENTGEAKISIEALLVDKIMRDDCTMKEAIKKVVNEHDFSKNQVYEASLNLKTKMSN